MVAVPVACAKLAGRVVTVGEETPGPAPVLAARTCAVAARCSAALRGLLAVKADCCAPSLGACVGSGGHGTGFTTRSACMDDFLSEAPTKKSTIAWR